MNKARRRTLARKQCQAVRKGEAIRLGIEPLSPGSAFRWEPDHAWQFVDAFIALARARIAAKHARRAA